MKYKLPGLELELSTEAVECGNLVVTSNGCAARGGDGRLYVLRSVMK